MIVFLNMNIGLKCFVDSNVWCYAGHIADMLNSNYSNKRLQDNGGCLYSHEKCLKVSEHVNTMLSIALQKMIDKSESIFLINTEQSIHINSDSKSIDLTYSPWIYQELVCSEIIRKKPLSLYRYNTELYHSISESYRFDNTNEVLTMYQLNPGKFNGKIENVESIWKVMWSKTLRWFYLIPLVIHTYSRVLQGRYH